MRKWVVTLLAIALVVALLVPVVTFGTVSTTYLVFDPTEEQVMSLLAGDLEHRVWLDDASQIMGYSYILQVTYRTRLLERDRILEFLDTLNVDYRLTKEGD